MVSSVDFCFDRISQKKDNRFGLLICRFRSGKNVKRLPLGVHVTEDDWKSFSMYYQEVCAVREQKNDGIVDRPDNFKEANVIVSTLGISNERLAIILDDIKDRLLSEESLLCTDSVVPLIVDTRVAMHLIDRFNKIESARRKKVKAISLVKFLEEYANDKESGKRLKEGGLSKVSFEYVKKLRMIASHWRAFERVHGEKIMLEDVTMRLREEYMEWCTRKGLSINSIVQRLEAVHCVMKVAYEEGYTENAIHAHSGFVPIPEKVGSVLINSAQLQELYESDLSSKEKIDELMEKCTIGKRRMERYKPLLQEDKIHLLAQARDIFVVGCLTGQRYSDYRRMNANMITEMNGMSFIGVVQQKTRKRVVIPLDERVVEILERYEEGLPDLSVEKVNECLHLIGELLQWTWKPIFSGNPPHSVTGSRFCDLLTSHTARRSFATNAYACRIPVESIMAVTGHTSELRLRGYVRDAPEVSASIVARDFERFLEL